MSIETIKNKELVRDLSVMFLKDRLFLERLYELAPSTGGGYKFVTALLSEDPRKGLEDLDPEYALVFDFVCEKCL